MRPVLVLLNPSARSGEHLQAARQALSEAGLHELRVLETSDSEEAARQLSEEVAAQAPMVVVGGGDGTLARAAARLRGSQTALGILPMGSGNTFARSLRLPLQIPAAAKVIAAQHRRQVDVGEVNGILFLNSVTLGLSAAIVEELNSKLKRRYGLLAWPIAALRLTHRHLREMQLELEEPGGRRQVLRTRQLVISNGPCIAASLIPTGSASLNNGRLDVFALGDGHWLGFASSLLALLSHRSDRSRATHFFETTELSVRSARSLAADVDGDLVTQTPLSIRVHPGALTVLAPPASDA